MLRSGTLAVIFVLVAFASMTVQAGEAPWRHGIAMHGDLKYGPDFEHFDYVNPNAVKGGQVRLNAIGGFDTLNQFTIKGQPAVGLSLLYDTLTETSADEPFSVYAGLAESVQMPEDRSWVAFRLYENAYWHDGKPLTADDVIFSFNLLMEKGSPGFQFYYAGVDQVIKIDERTVKFTFKSQNRELPLILGQFQILPKHYWENRDFEKTTLEPPLGSGPYKIKSLDPGRSITYERVENYWGQNKPTHKGFYNFGEIRYDYYRDSTVAIEAFKAGEYDYRSENSSKHWATSYKIAAVKDGRIILDEVGHERVAGMQAFVFNLRRSKFQDPRVREALSYAFDFEWANTNLFYGQYTRSRSFFDNSELAATGVPDDAELQLLEPFRAQLPPDVFTKEYYPPTTHGGPSAIRKNLRKASQMLQQAGWVVVDKKRVNAETGESLDFEILLVSPLFERIVLSMKRNLERLGISIRIRTVDSSQYLERLKTFDYDMIVGNWGQSLSPGNEQMNYWGSASADREGSRNYAGIKNSAVDALIEDIISAPDRATLVTATRALDRVLQWNHFVIPQWHLSYQRLAFWNKFGRPDVVPSSGSQFMTWWVDPKKAEQLAGR